VTTSLLKPGLNRIDESLRLTTFEEQPRLNGEMEGPYHVESARWI